MYWPNRSAAMTQTLNALRSDVYILQEVVPEILSFMDGVLVNYKRIIPTSSNDTLLSWTSESNIYWNDTLLTLVDHGKSDLNIVDYPRRGLFWVRLAVKAQPYLTIFIATAHFPWVGCPTELQTGLNQRIPAAVKVCQCFRTLLSPDEPIIFGGDFNDDFHPLRVFQEEMGLLEVFESLDLPPPITHPVRPSSPQEEARPNKTSDWIMCSLPRTCRVVAAYAKEIRGGAFPPASDHKPVTAIFEIA